MALNPLDVAQSGFDAAQNADIDALQASVVALNGGSSMGLRSGRYYDSGNGMAIDDPGKSEKLDEDYLYAVPILIEGDAVVLDRIGIHVLKSGKSGTKIRFGIYANVDGLPAELLLDAGEANLKSGIQELAILLPYSPGWLWAAVGHSDDDDRKVRAIDKKRASSKLGFGTAEQTDKDLYVRRSWTYGALPDPFGSASYRHKKVPRIFVRVA